MIKSIVLNDSFLTVLHAEGLMYCLFLKLALVKKILTCLFSILTWAGYAQTVKYPVVNIPVERNGLSLQNPWCGGLNAPQFSAVDLNGDGIQDLFVFDRGGDKVLTFINDGSHSDSAFHYAPEYEKLFPPMTIWAILRDYNHDGIPDIFTDQVGETDPQGHAVPPGIKVYKGSRINGNLHFDVVQYCLYYTSGSFTVPLWVNGLGLPAITDVNRDGDLDILAFNVYGTAAEYYENQTLEQGLSPDSLVFSQVSQCWGNFYVNSPTLQVELNISCKGGGSEPHDSRHTGSALSAIDYQNDHDVDILLSGVHVDFMSLLTNTGDSSNANIGWIDSLWPSCNSTARMPYFPGAYQVDADNDGLEDLLVAPIFSSPAIDVNNVMLYKNISGDTCNYQYASADTFLVNTLLDFGTDSKGVFFDYNGDGLMDIIAGNYYTYNPVVAGVSRLALYENTGTNTHPQFREISADYSGLSTYALLGINPAFGDLDGDGRKDMLVGDANGNIHFFKNAGGATALFPSMTTPMYDSINTGGNAAPFIYDVNGDSLPDLVIGRMDGGLSYYWNFGTRTNPMFSVDSVNTTFGQINVTLSTVTIGNSQPFIMSDSLGNMLLFVGSDQGFVFEYLVDRSHLRSGSFLLIDSNFLHYDAGQRVTMQAYDLNADGKMEYLIGNALGGLEMYSETVWDSSALLSTKDVAPEGLMFVFPNPANDEFTCLIKNEVLTSAQVELYDMTGRRAAIPSIIQNDRVMFSSAKLSAGVYFLRITTGNNAFTNKIVIRH